MVCSCMVCRHVLLKYGKSNTSKKSQAQAKSRAQRIEQLKQMYKRGLDIDCADHGLPTDDVRGGEVEQDEVDQLLQWTQDLDEQVLNRTSQ